MNLKLHLGQNLLGSVDSLRVEQGHDPAGTTEQWIAVLDLPGPTPALREAATAALQSLVGQIGPVLLLSGETVLRRRDVADCRVAPRLLRVRAGTSQPETAMARATVEVVLACTLQNAAQAVQAHEVTTQLVVRAGQTHRLLTRGRVVLRAGESPSVALAEIAPVAAGWRRLGAVHTRDAQVPSLEYELEDERPFAPLPAGVEDGQVTHTLGTDAQGRQIRTTSGFFVGPGALARAQELQPAAPQTARLSESPQLARVDFEFTEILGLPLHPGLLALHETLVYTTQRQVVDHPLLAAGMPRYRQQIGAAFTQVAQQGSARGESSHPAPAPALFAGDVIEREIAYSRPEGAQHPQERFVTTWRYVMRLRGEMAPTPPSAG